jgi:toxin ParE1/3/4
MLNVLRSRCDEWAEDPYGRNTHARDNLLSGVRSFHIRHARSDEPSVTVRKPVHILYYCKIDTALIEIVRVLHERMDPTQHFGSSFEE